VFVLTFKLYTILDALPRDALFNRSTVVSLGMRFRKRTTAFEKEEGKEKEP
jgi:hypothetical protein